MNASDVLYGAADHIEAFGHAKYRLHGEGDPQTAPACALGAIIVASGSGVTASQAWMAAAALRNYLCGEMGTGTIPHWNNAPERTAEQVIATLRAAAVIEAAKENAEIKVSA